MSEKTFDLNNATTLQVNSDVNIPSINYKAAMASYTPDEQKEIMDLADKIDVTEFQKIMSYGSLPLISSFEQCGVILKEEQGSEADKRVINEIVELSSEIDEKFEDFNNMLKEPSFFEKLLFNFSISSKKKEKFKKLQEKALSSYSLGENIRERYAVWLNSLQNTMYQVTSSSVSERVNTETLEKYIIAGYIASSRIEKDLADKKAVYDTSGLTKDEQEYEKLKEGYELFQRTLISLEKSRFANKLSIGRLKITEKSNRNIQMAVMEQQKNGMTLFAQLLRDSVLDFKNREVLEGHQAITRLTDELMVKVTNNVALTSEESKLLIQVGFCSLKSMKESLDIMRNSFEKIQKSDQEYIDKSKVELSEAAVLLDQIEPHINQIKQSNPNLATSASQTTSSATTTSGNSGSLQF